jgi:hypothetical protein
MSDHQQEMAEQTLLLNELKTKLDSETNYEKSMYLRTEMLCQYSVLLYILRKEEKRIQLDDERIHQRLNNTEE